MRLALGLVLLFPFEVTIGQQQGTQRGSAMPLQPPAMSGKATVRLLVETDSGVTFERKSPELAELRRKFRERLEAANLIVVEGGTTKYDAVVRVHYGGCAPGSCAQELAVMKNGKPLAVYKSGSSSRYSDHVYIGEFASAVLANDPSPLIKMLSSKDSLMRSSAPSLLEFFPQPSVVSALGDELTSGYSTNAVSALLKLSEKSKTAELWQPLFNASTDDEWTRRAFKGCFAASPDGNDQQFCKWAKELMLSLASSRDPEVRRSAKILQAKLDAH